MSTNSVTVQQAIDRGLRTVSAPSKTILTTAVVLAIVVPFIYYTWLVLVFIPAGILLSILYPLYAAPKWRIWAYQHVDDIHQLQRSAELAGIVMLHSHERATGIMSRRDRERLTALLARFSEPNVFIDDPSIPGEVVIDSSLGENIIINDAGIRVHTGEFFEWDGIHNERIIQKTFSRMNRRGYRMSAGSAEFFRFNHPEGLYEAALSSLNMQGWQIDLLMYIYRGRWQHHLANTVSLE